VPTSEPEKGAPVVVCPDDDDGGEEGAAGLADCCVCDCVGEAVCGDCAGGGVVPCCGVFAEGAGVYVGLEGCCCCRAKTGDAAATQSSAAAMSLPIK
jgi:hypothetical protein